jgi:nucleotide-binding universal stress UspA family protein
MERQDMRSITTEMKESSLLKGQIKKASVGKHLLAVLNITSEVEPVMEIATALAGAYKGRITAINFVVLPYQTPLSVGLLFAEGPSKNLGIARQYHSKNMPVDCLLLLSHNRKLSILNTTREKNINFVIGSFQGFMDIYKNLRGALSSIPTDTLILRPFPDKKIGDYKRVLVPFVNGPQTSLAVDIACDLAKTLGQKLAILHGFEPQINEEPWERILNRLETRPGSLSVERLTYGRNSIISSMLKEAKKDTWLILPVYRPSWLMRFGLRYKQKSLLEEIIRHLEAPIMIVKRHERKTGFRNILKREWTRV